MEVETAKSYLDLLPPELGARINRILEKQPKFALMMDLPYEVQLYVAAQLSAVDLMNFCVTSKAAQQICNDDFFWKIKTQRDFSQRYPDWERLRDPEDTWKEKYRRLFFRTVSDFNRAIVEGYVEQVRELIDFGVSPNNFFVPHFGKVDETIAEWNEQSQTPLMEAVRDISYPEDLYSEKIEIIQILLDAGADVNASNSIGETPLTVALSDWGASPETIKLLIAVGADVNVGERSPLEIAVRSGNEEIVALLIEAGANVNATDEDGKSLLSIAFDNRKHNIVKLLKDAGAKKRQQRRRKRRRGKGAKK